MSESLSPGFSKRIRAGDALAAAENLRPVLGEVAIDASASGFGMEFSLAVFETARFWRWHFAQEAQVAGGFEHHVICTAPKGRVSITHEGGTLVLDKNSAAILAPSRLRRMRWHGEATLLGISLFERDFRQGAHAVQSGKTSVRLGPGQIFDLSVYPGTIFAELLKFLQADHDRAEGWKTNQSVRVLFDRLIVYSLLQLLQEGGVKQDASDQKTLVPRHVKLAEDYIKTHLTERLDAAKLAKVAAVSLRSLHRGFVQFRGVTPARHIHNLRLDAAQRLLMAGDGNADLSNIARAAGFHSYPAFWRGYVRKFGIPPSKAYAARNGSEG